MKIPLAYPKIPLSTDFPCKDCFVFDKIDGTNLHFLFKNNELAAFGTRRHRYTNKQEFIDNHPELSKTLDDELLNVLPEVFKATPKFKQVEQIIAFAEYAGEQSFAGSHQENDPTKHLHLFDIEINGEILSPQEFIKDFQVTASRLPKLIYHGKYSGQLVENIRLNKYNLKEGAVIKGTKNNQLFMVKVKTDQYMEKLKQSFNYWQDFRE